MTHPVSFRKFFIAAFVLAGVAYLGFCGLLYFSQRSYLYFPTSRSADVPALTMSRGDADVVVSTNNLNSNRAVLYFGGNAEDVSRSITPLAAAFPGAAIYAMHYRSYGGSTGAPTESGLVADGIALSSLVTKRHPGIVIVGRSLGSGVAVQVAAVRRPERLVLVTPFNSIAELAAELFRFFPTGLILQDKYESWRYVGRMQVPTTIIMAADDEVIPDRSSRKLAQAFPAGVVDLVVIAGAGHNDVSNFPEYAAALRGQPVSHKGRSQNRPPR